MCDIMLDRGLAASWHSSLSSKLVMHCLSVTRGITMADSPAHIAHSCRLKAGLKELWEEARSL